MINKLTFPLKMTFSFWFGYEIKVTNPQDQEVFFVQQKALKLKEHIEIFSDSSKTDKLFDIKTNKIFDFSANYIVTDASQESIGYVRRKGWASIFSATYEIYTPEDKLVYTIKEANAFVKFMDAFLSEIPILNLFSGFLFNPQYILKATNGEEKYKLSKVPTFMSRIFTIEDLTPNQIEHPELCAISYMMMLILERRRG